MAYGRWRWDDPRFDEVRAWQRKAGPVDLHVDVLGAHRLTGYAPARRHRAGFRGQPLFWHTDLPRLREAGYAGAALGILYWPWESERGWRELKRQIALLDGLAEADETVIRVRHPSDWERARVEGRLALAPGVEGAHLLNGRVERVADLARLGVLYLTLVHFRRNAFASPSVGVGARDDPGLTARGRELVVALNAHGILVDVAHLSNAGVLEVCRLSEAPVVASHTGVRRLCRIKRNLTDEAIDAIAATGGVIGIFFAPNGLAGRLHGTSSLVLDHVGYVAERVGVEHVALGSDFDGGVPTIPHDMRDCRDLVKVTAGLKRRGFDRREIAKILGGNVRRVAAAAGRCRRGVGSPAW